MPPAYVDHLPAQGPLGILAPMKRRHDSTRVIVEMPRDLLKRIKKFQHARELDSRAEAIRTLIEQALAQAEAQS